jgi:transcriptional regulator
MMYIPASFAEADRELLLDFIEEHGFASLISSGDDGAPTVSHVPLLLDRAIIGSEYLLGHVARANRHWAKFDGRTPTLAIFNGPHAYVSPAWYAKAPSVPTWNYAVVHVHGTAQTLDAAGTEAVLRRLIEQYEGTRKNRWSGDLPIEFMRNQLRAIVGFRLELGELVGKFKLSQNKDETDREGALAGLEQEPDVASRALASFTRKYLQRKAGS